MSAAEPVAPALPVAGQGVTLPPTGRTKRSPHPVVWVELLQAVRIRYLPLLITAALMLCTLAVAVVGGLLSTSVDAAELGSIVYQIFFGSVFALTAWLSPLLGAWLIAREQRDHTRDALILSGLSGREIARGKFLAGMSLFGSALALLLPVGALSFVAGGVAASEVLFAGLWLGIFGCMGVAVGCAIGARAQRPSKALGMALGSGLFASLIGFVGFGVAGAYFAHQVWPEVISAVPVWLPLAYSRARLDLAAWVSLAVAPLLLSGMVTSLGFELTVKGLERPSPDPNRGLKRWASLALPVWLAVALVPRLWLAARDQYWIAFAGALGGSTLFGWGLLLLLAGEPGCEQQRAGSAARNLRVWLEPGLPRGLAFILALHLLSQLLVLTLATLQELGTRTLLGDSIGARLSALGWVAFTGTALVLFGAGLLGFLRRHGRSASHCRLTLTSSLLVIGAGPWLLLLASGGARRAPALAAIAAASPGYAGAVAQQFNAGELAFGVANWPTSTLIHCVTTSLLALLGALLLVLSLRRSQRAAVPKPDAEASLP